MTAPARLFGMVEGDARPLDQGVGRSSRFNLGV
jgi:hypothetical protein